MEPLLDETTLVPCLECEAGIRIAALAATLRSLDALGMPRVLRGALDAADRNIEGGHGLRYWCFRRGQVDDIAGRLVASRLAKAPFIDGPDGLFAMAEGSRAIETTVHGQTVLALGLAALSDRMVVCLSHAAQARGSSTVVRVLEYLDEGQEHVQEVDVVGLMTPSDVDQHQGELLEALDAAITSGKALLEQSSDLFPALSFGPEAEKAIRELSGNEVSFKQLVRHLRALSRSAQAWPGDRPFAPQGVSWSEESEATLTHGHYGPMRDFACPPGFRATRWSAHTKMTGDGGRRLYFSAEPIDGTMRVAIGYVGPHLLSAKFG